VSEVAQRFRRVAGRFTDAVQCVPADSWDNPAPCEGWVARDVVRHLVEWVPSFLRGGAGLELAPGPSADDDPVGAWLALGGALQAVLDDAGLSARELTNEHTGRHRVDDAIGMFVLGDVLIHTWDLARAAGLDETLDAGEVHRMVVGLEPLGDALSLSGHYAARVELPSGADEQTRLLALTGRRR